MRLELGIFIGAKAFGGKDHWRKAAIVFDTDRFTGIFLPGGDKIVGALLPFPSRLC